MARTRCSFLAWRVWGICLALIPVAALGCGGNKSIADFKPSPQSAKQALEAALKAWQSGAAYGPIAAAQPTVNVFDGRWRDGGKLESFTIVEEVPGSEFPTFKVKLKLASAAEETDTFHVLGIDPLNVFRDLDYRQATGEGDQAPPAPAPTDVPPPASVIDEER